MLAGTAHHASIDDTRPANTIKNARKTVLPNQNRTRTVTTNENIPIKVILNGH